MLFNNLAHLLKIVLHFISADHFPNHAIVFMFPTFHTAICFCSSVKVHHKNDLIHTRVTLLSNDNVVLSRDLVLLLKLMQK